MKRIAHIVTIASVFAIAACGNNTSEVGVLEKKMNDSVSAPIQEVADTTLQPTVEIVLRATGDEVEEMVFDQDTLEVEADALVKLTLINEGTDLNAIHNFVVITEGMLEKAAKIGAEIGPSGNYIPDSKHVLTATPLALPSQTVVHEFKAPPPGTYDFVCTYPDHWRRMNGKLIVK
ncbi:plastocyanin/azurin family copper-binding protein [Pontibacter populi]|uniref:Plastocyanin/azurin family copper-binding protein n=1 Tax=Pontibacter populi TaxID=890055 RepID=A0ABV1RYY6_9BACT